MYSWYMHKSYLVVSTGRQRLGNLNKLSSILLVVGAWHASLVCSELVQGLECDVKLRRSVELGKVRDDEVRVGKRVTELFLMDESKKIYVNTEWIHVYLFKSHNYTQSAK